MKITKYNKISLDKYQIYLEDGTSLSLYQDIILKYELLTKKEINNSLYLDIKKDNDLYEAYYKTIKYLNVKMRSKKEIRKYLKEYDDKIINYVIDRLHNEGYLNDKIYINSYVNDAVNLKMSGYNKIKDELVNLELPIDLILNKLDSIDEEVWINKIDKLISKKLKCNKKYSNKMLEDKIINDLVKEGYQKNLVLRVLDGVSFDSDSSALDKEYNKQYRLLSKKYCSKELEYKLINKLLSKGFSYDDIKNKIK